MAINKLRQIAILSQVPNYGQGETGYSDEPDYGSEEGYDPNYGYSDEPSYQQPNIPVPDAPRVATPAVDPNARSSRIFDMMNQAYTPETTSRDRFNTLLDNMPERNSPGIARKIVAGGIGLDARNRKGNPLEAMEQVMYAPYLRDMAEFGAKAQPFQQAAQLENTANINERTLAGNMITAQTQADRLAEQARQADQKNEVARVVAQARLATANRWTVKLVGERVIAYSPDGKESMDLGSSGNMTQQDKIELENSGRLAAAQAIGGAYYNTPGGVMQGNPRTNEGFTPVPGAPRGPVTEVGGAGRGAGNTPSQERAATNNDFREFSLVNPEAAAKYLKPPITVNGDWGFKPPVPTGGFMGIGRAMDPNQIKEYNEVRKALGYPPMPEAPPPPVAAAPPKPGNQPIGGSNRVPVPAPRPPDAPDPFMQGGGQQQVDPFAQPAIQPGQNLGRPSEVIGAARESLRPKPEAAPTASPGQVMQEIATGSRLQVKDPKTGNVVGSIPNTAKAIDAAIAKGLRVEVK